MDPRRAFLIATSTFVLVALFLDQAAAPCQAARWRNIGPYGGEISNLVVDPDAPTTLYAGTHKGGVFKTTNGGATWTAANSGLPGDLVVTLAIDPVTPATLYAGIGNAGVYKSTNGGATWTRSDTGVTNGQPSSLAIDPSHPATLYLVTLSGASLFRSTNAGANWTPFTGPAGVSVSQLAIDPTNSNLLYAATSGGVFKSTNAGASWNPSSTGLIGSSGAVVIDPSLPSTLYSIGGYDASTGFTGAFKSVNSGANWAPLNNGLTHPQVSDLEIEPGNSANLWVSTFTGIFRSQNGGTLWTPANGGLPDQGSFGALVLDPSAPSTLYCGFGRVGVFKSVDSGANWALATNGMSSLEVRRIAVNPQVAGNLFVAGGGSVYRSPDEGASWSSARLTPNQVYSLAIDPQTPATLFAGTNDGVLWKSDDGAVSWSPANNGINNASIFDLAVDPASPSTLYAAGFGGTHRLFRSDNGAASWNPADTGLPSDLFWSLVLDPQNPNHLFAGSSANGLFVSSNGGSSWGPSGAGITNPSIYALAAANATTYYAGTAGGGAFKTSNGGAQWNPVNSGLPGNVFVTSLAVDTASATTLYAGTLGSGVFRSGDAGAHWTAINAGLTDFGVWSLAVDPSAPDVLYAGTLGGSVFRLALSPDPPPGPYLTTPNIPGFRFKVRITSGSQLIAGKSESDCIGETLCISGAKAGRSELFARVIGPRPNGFLWLNLVRFTTSRVEVWAEHLRTGEVNYYDMPALPADGTVLLGLVDKEAFEPPALKAGPAVSAPASAPASEFEIEAGGLAAGSSEATFVAPAFPDYRFTVRIFSGALEQPAKLESDCIPETACVSGGKPGRSELFLRIIGPRPNGFLWVNLVRFTTSRVEVKIERISTGATHNYTLAQVATDSAELPGLVDKEAFVP